MDEMREMRSKYFQNVHSLNTVSKLSKDKIYMKDKNKDHKNKDQFEQDKGDWPFVKFYTQTFQDQVSKQDSIAQIRFHLIGNDSRKSLKPFKSSQPDNL